MPTVREIKTPQAIAAVNRIKSLVKREPNKNWGDIPKEFIEKRNYMQSDEFLNDTHNAAMFELGDAFGRIYEMTNGIRKQIQEVREEINKLKKYILDLK